ncbi:hypothetical protein AT6N2_C3211 [Agrobacterium tumefaciens]|nr:hypothetical protein AT6N2_C3211 [Agrobacterium tumefaciens]
MTETINLALAGQRHQRYLPLLAGLETHCRAGRNIETHAARLVAVEEETRIGLEKMVVAAHLHRPVARIGDFDGHGRLAGIEFDAALCGNDFAWVHSSISTLRSLWFCWRSSSIWRTFSGATKQITNKLSDMQKVVTQKANLAVLRVPFFFRS